VDSAAGPSSIFRRNNTRNVGFLADHAVFAPNGGTWRMSDGVFGFFGRGERFDRMSKVALTCFGETDPARRAMQKLHAEPRFKLADALADC
jgi:hypothetical protein